MISDDKVKKALWGACEEQFDNDILLEQYKLYVEMADRISSRRDTANNYFLGINGLLIASGAPLLTKYLEVTSDWFALFPFLIICLLLFFWWKLINSYKQLNSAKFRIIGLLEEKLPAKIYGEAEWKTLLEEGKNRKTYWPLTHLESKVPGIFFLGYLLLFLGVLLSR